MKKYYDLVVVIPAGPNVSIEFLEDTIKSVEFYCKCSQKIIISDDSQKGIGKIIKESFPDLDVILTTKNHKSEVGYGALYVTLSLAFKHALENYSFKTLLKLDTDALVIGPDPQKDAEQMFANDPSIAIAGLYKTGDEIYDFNNNIIDNRWPRGHLIRATSTWRIIKRPLGNFTLRKYFLKALANGYELGENIFGGSYFTNEPFLKSLNENGLLPVYNLHNSRLGEDHLFGMFAKMLGFNLGDLATGNLPFGVAWKGLPASPETLLARGKKIIHSTRRWEGQKEAEIREYFRKVRNEKKYSDINKAG